MSILILFFLAFIVWGIWEQIRIRRYINSGEYEIDTRLKNLNK